MIELEVVTNNSDEYLDESIIALDELQANLMDSGIDLDYKFEAIHDRHIQANNGWKITLGRGLDIFEKIEGRYNMENLD